MSLKFKALLAGILALAGFLLWPSAQQAELHTELQQRLLEAELGSTSTFHFAPGAYAVVPDDTAVDTLLKNLGSWFPERRWQAAKQLARRHDSRAVEAIIRAMRDPGGTRRVCVMASALGHFRDPRALSALTEAVFDPVNRDLRFCAIQSLGMMGDRTAVPILIAALVADNTPVAAANAIARLGDERGVDPIIHAARDPRKRFWMITALGELGSPLARPYLRSVDARPEIADQQAARESLWKIDQLSVTGSAAVLATVLTTDTDVNHRMWAAFRLGEMPRAVAVPALIMALEDSSREVRGRAAAALVRAGAVALPAVRRQISGSHGSKRLYATAILGYIGGQSEVALLQNSIIRHGEQGDQAGVARRSIDLIDRFSRPDTGFTEYGVIE